MDLTKTLSEIARALNAKFTLNDRPIGPEEIFADTGLLPALSRRADQLCSLCLGYGIGVSFEEVEKSTLGVRVVFDDATPNILRYFCITDVLSELIRTNTTSSGLTPLDELLYD
ncbi:MAG: type IV secretion IcmS family protein [Gammaproteobacteria bacterium]